VNGELHAPAALPPGKGAPVIHSIGGCVDPRTGLDNMENLNFLTLQGLELDPSVVQPVASRYTNHATAHRKRKETPWPESASELYRPSDRRLSAKLVPTFEDRRCHVVSVTDTYGRYFGFLDRSRYFFFQVALQLYSRGWVDHVPDPLFLRKSGSAGNRTRTRGSVVSYSDH
jgi:hypothetical protein